MIRIPVWFLAWPRWRKQLLVVLFDMLLCVLTVWMAVSLRYEVWVSFRGEIGKVFLLSLALALPLFVKFGFYRAIFRYVGIKAIASMGLALSVYAALFALAVGWLALPGVPRSVGLIQPLLLLVLVALSRTVVRLWLGENSKFSQVRRGLEKVVIYGAGSAGRQLASGLVSSSEFNVKGFIDDDESLQGRVLNGVPIYGLQNMSELIDKHQVSVVLLALPSATRERRHQILEALREHRLKVRTVPSLPDLIKGRVDASLLRELDVEDLLGREPVPPHAHLLNKNIRKKVVLVSGAGGSIGSELCRQIIKSGPSVLLLVELNEFALYTVHQELEKLVASLPLPVEVVPLLGNVCNAARMSEILSTWHPSTVYHAAAYKHVPLVEHNPAEGFKNNVQGTQVLALQASVHGVRDFVLISTDKAVRPTNVMGATKRLAEMVLQAQAQGQRPLSGGTCFSMVRFGNVLGSSGSVVPLFRAQIKQGGPITLTDRRITRYFMTIPEAAQLVLQAGAMASGGDVFVLDMGSPVRIVDLAKRMVELSGLTVRDELNPGGDIEIKVTGLRPGEKLYEELLMGDNPLPTIHALIMKAHEDFLPSALLEQKLNALNDAVALNDVPRIRALLKDAVPGYRPVGEVVDWVWMENAKVA